MVWELRFLLVSSVNRLSVTPGRRIARPPIFYGAKARRILVASVMVRKCRGANVEAATKKWLQKFGSMGSGFVCRGRNPGVL